MKLLHRFSGSNVYADNSLNYLPVKCIFLSSDPCSTGICTPIREPLT